MTEKIEFQSSICRVERGLYLCHYVEAIAEPYPQVDLTVTAGRIELVSAPGRERSTLTAPGQTLVLLADGTGEFEIRVSSVGHGGTDAKVSIDLIDAGEGSRIARSSAAQPDMDERQRSRRPPKDGSDRVDLSILAHVSRRGDVAVGADAWVAGPDQVLPIEGLAIATGRDDLGVRLRVRSAQGGPEWSRWHDPGKFAGSRQRADALTSLALELTGGAAGHFEIRAEVMTLGSPIVTKTGRAVEFFGFDPIVGFRFGLNAATVSEHWTTQRQVAPVRVFRAKR